MPSIHFSSKTDSRYLRERHAEKHRLFYSPRQWLVHTDSITTDIYGDPGVAASGTDGITSIPSTREFTSATGDFVNNGVQANDTLEIFNQPCVTKSSSNVDNGLYTVVTVTETVLTVDSDWPEGSQDNLDYTVRMVNERYAKLNQLLPFMIKLNPTRKVLEKWGITEERDAIVELSALICEEAGLTPKIGDRFIHVYGPRNVHYEVLNLFPVDSLGDSGDFISWLGFAKKTTNKLGV